MSMATSLCPKRLIGSVDGGPKQDDVLDQKAAGVGAWRQGRPGVEKRNERVVMKMRIPTRLPAAESFGDTERRAIKIPVITSASPKSVDHLEG
jgi:hypothetical protein